MALQGQPSGSPLSEWRGCVVLSHYPPLTVGVPPDQGRVLRDGVTERSGPTLPGASRVPSQSLCPKRPGGWSLVLSWQGGTP